MQPNDEFVGNQPEPITDDMTSSIDETMPESLQTEDELTAEDTFGEQIPAEPITDQETTNQLGEDTPLETLRDDDSY